MQTYEELMELAEKGNNLNLDIASGQILNKTEDSKNEDDIYAALRNQEPRPIFLWGLGAGKYISKSKSGNKVLPAGFTPN